MKQRFFLLAFVWVAGALASAQNQPVDGLSNIQANVAYLADDAQEGRLTGTDGAYRSAQYIRNQFIQLGLKPFGTEDGLVPFPFTQHIKVRISPDPMCALPGKFYAMSAQSYPISGSGSGQPMGKLIHLGFGISAPEHGHDDYAGKPDLKGKIGLIDIGLPPLPHPHSPLAQYASLVRRIRTAEQKGLAGVLFYRKDTLTDKPSQNLSPRVPTASIPALFVDEDLSNQDGKPCRIEINLQKTTGTGYNVAFLQDNGANRTIVIGAHYDHVGWGEENSRYRGATPAVHNGADDNASGVAAMLQVAHVLRQKPLAKYNVLYVAFSGEELGLLGSSAFVEHPELQHLNLRAMLNMDMVGRLEKETKGLVINGVGTSPVFTSITDTLRLYGISVKTTESGVGPSDHASFYHKGIPAVHFFTGTHADYHMPSDDIGTLNLQGILEVSDYVAQMSYGLDRVDTIPFQKTKEPEQTRMSAKVSLGVVPDYAWEGKGMKISGVTEGKPAAIAGLMGGDILLAIDGVAISDIYGYMNVLGKYAKGQSSLIKFKRQEEEKEVTITW
jgi:aminopeptidase YwaD